MVHIASQACLSKKNNNSQAAKVVVVSGTVSKYAHVAAMEGFRCKPDEFQTLGRSGALPSETLEAMLYLQAPDDRCGPISRCRVCPPMKRFCPRLAVKVKSSPGRVTANEGITQALLERRLPFRVNVREGSQGARERIFRLPL